MLKAAPFCTLILALLISALFLSGCSSGKSSSTSTGAFVNVRVSDPATCSGPKGTFSHIYVTITDVQINASSSAGSNDSGWIDLTPSLSQNPQQVDLLGQANNQCFLATLGATTALQPGSYQQIRIMLASNNSAVSNNLCGGTANCVMLSSSPSVAQPLLLSSESQTGLKIPSGQIAGGQFVIAAGETKDLDIDFNACESIVTEGQNRYRLKPVLHGGEVSLTSSSINGTIVDSVTNQAVSGGTTVVALEQKDGSGVDRVIMETVTDASGAFSFCPVAAGTYDVVAVAVSGTQVAYAATVITGVQPGNALGMVPVVAQTGISTAPGSITGQITTSTGAAATAADISLSALQPINSATMVTIPLAGQSAATANLTTATGSSCPANTDCVSYTLSVPALNPSVGAFLAGPSQKPAAPVAGPVNYTIDAFAFTTDGTSTLNCSPSEMRTSTSTTNMPLTVAPGQSSAAATLAFSGCQ
ncbi:MAG TPA: DUF4382 domain-containing protein [Candidatus Dormibacteraeota bacterium]|nr:DUF4382 domain-containing protein [Candidatus Dormibacteraeota bacterium]